MPRHIKLQLDDKTFKALQKKKGSESWENFILGEILGHNGRKN